MADPPKQDGDSQKNPLKQEASAADLLSLWGGGKTTTPAPKPMPMTKPVSMSVPAPTSLPASRPTPTSIFTPTPVKKIEPGVKPELAIKPVVEPRSRPMPQPHPVAPQPHTAPAPQPHPAPKPHLEPPPKENKAAAHLSWGDIVSKKEPELKPEKRPEYKPEPRPEPKLEYKPKPESEPKPEYKPKPKPEPELEPKFESQSKSKTEVLEGELVTDKIPAKMAPKTEKESAPADEKPVEFLEEEDGFAAKLEEFLREFNLTRDHIFYACGALALIVILAFTGIWGFKYFKNKGDTKVVEPERPATVILNEETGIIGTASIGEMAVLDRTNIGTTGIAGTVSLGVEMEGHTDLAAYIVLFRKLQNIYVTDLDELLGKSVDRRGKLKSHVSLLKQLSVDANAALKKIKEEIEVIKVQYDSASKRQQEADSNFFDQLNAFNGQTAEDIFYDFINVSKNVVTLRSRYKALQKIQAFYEQALPKLERRINDIELNEDALVAGIKVYDMSGSDLKLILPAQGEEATTERLDSSPAVPFLPVTPLQINTGKDFITQPGGGF